MSRQMAPTTAPVPVPTVSCQDAITSLSSDCKRVAEDEWFGNVPNDATKSATGCNQVLAECDIDGGCATICDVGLTDNAKTVCINECKKDLYEEHNFLCANENGPCANRPPAPTTVVPAPTADLCEATKMKYADSWQAKCEVGAFASMWTMRKCRRGMRLVHRDCELARGCRIACGVRGLSGRQRKACRESCSRQVRATHNHVCRDPAGPCSALNGIDTIPSLKLRLSSGLDDQSNSSGSSSASAGCAVGSLSCGWFYALLAGGLLMVVSMVLGALRMRSKLVKNVHDTEAREVKNVHDTEAREVKVVVHQL